MMLMVRMMMMMMLIMMMMGNEEAQQVGSWSTEAGLDIKDIVWPNESRVPPKVSTN